MTIAIVGTTKLDGFGTTLDIPYASTAGNLLVVHVSVGNVLTPTDTAGNTWTLALNTSTIGSTSQRLGQVYYCLNASAITSLTLTHAASQNYVAIVTELSGVASYRGGAMNTGTSTAATTSVVAGDMVLSGCFYFKTAATAAAPFPAGWTGIDTGIRGNNFNGLAYQAIAADGTSGPSWALGSNGAHTVTAWVPSVTEVFTNFRWTGSAWVPMRVKLGA
ncbi:hypothetical protein [Paeniglutamicibacter terrestris]|uniref:WxL domain-containing protein n=1 Tax=Paeniglutamicibacter terrestris TaxID=2723403 RepID=A0ABX1G4E4_9MICC|nr:hypothetical protein [Paeniglutamicibacter terrestris]NKG21123.1 hypothetical protein [Paeniglutamicibacter terrestris]